MYDEMKSVYLKSFVRGGRGWFILAWLALVWIAMGVVQLDSAEAQSEGWVGRVVDVGVSDVSAGFDCGANPLAYAMRPVAYTDYYFATSGPFYNFDMYVTWESAPSGEAYIYPAFQFFFQANQGGYMGIQMVGNTKKAIFSIWDVDSNPGSAQPAWSSCGRFDWEGNGTRCIIDYRWKEGREYELRLRAYGLQTDGELWIGTIYDTVTYQETTIGIIHLKDSNGYKGYGRLRPDVHVFFEYFGGADTCENQPYARVLWRGPFADNKSVFQSRAVVPAHICDSTNVTTRGYLTVVHEAGGDTQRTTPDGTVLWEWAGPVYRAYLPLVSH